MEGNFLNLLLGWNSGGGGYTKNGPWENNFQGMIPLEGMP